MQVSLSVRDHDGTCHDVAVTTSRQVSLAELRGPLADCLGHSRDAAVSSGNGPLPDGALLGGPGLRSGSTLQIDAGGERFPPAGSVLQLRVIAGPDCGQLIALRRGGHLIGRAADADISLDDPDVSRRHCEIRVDLRALMLRDLGSTNGTLLDGALIDEQPRQLTLNSVVRIGNSMLSVVGVSDPPAVTRPACDGSLLVYRPPRILEPDRATVVQFPATHDPTQRPKLNWLAALLPAALAVALSVVMHSAQFLAFALLGPATLFATAFADRRQWRQGARQHRQLATIAEAAAQAELDGLLVAEQQRRRRRFVDAAAVLHAASTPDCRLWERRTADDFFLELRLGIADQPALTRARRDNELEPADQLSALPATIALCRGPLGLAGPQQLVRAAAQWLLAQILALHSPTDVTVVAMVDGQCAEWRWLRWPAGVSAIASTAAEHQQLVDELCGIADARRQANGVAIGDRWLGQWIVLLIDPASTMAGLTGLRELLANGQQVGITAVCIGEDPRVLPPSCTSTAITVTDTGAQVDIASSGTEPLRATADRVGSGWAERFARQLAALRDADAGNTAELASSVSLIELLSLDITRQQSILDRWSACSGRVAAPIGLGSRATFELDLMRDGPHLLIAGTTGSGKSELLRTLVAALAANHPPSEVTFVLIDYKGGAAFAECAGLPHTLGVVTDLDGYLTRRALASLEAELRRRELAFAGAAVTDLAGYRTSSAGGRSPLPRLVLIIDEFAALAEELPDFLSGLLGIAQRGRSLGVHLILATQRPAGVVSLDIKANMALRIALRVTDAGESSDVIGDDAASRISKRLPGRALARTADGDLVEFQAARVGLPLRTDETITVQLLDFWNRPLGADGSAPVADNDLKVLCDSVGAAASRAGQPVPRRPWLAPLPHLVLASQLDDLDAAKLVLPYGITDDPAQQRQLTAIHDLAAGGAIGFIGGARSGRTTALRTLLGQAVARLGRDRLHLYLIDTTGCGFRPLAGLPQCGAVVDRDDPRSILRLVSRLAGELAERQRTLAELGVASFAEAATLGISLPVAVVALDGWEGFATLSEEQDAGRSADMFVQLLRDGPTAGFNFLITGDRTALGQRLSTAVGTKYLLRMTDRADYATAGLDPASVPAELRPGQAIRVEDGLETQLALLDSDPSAAAQWAALHRAAITDPSLLGGPTIRIRTLPDQVSLADLLDSVDSQRTPDSGCVLGVGGDDASTVRCDLFGEHGRFLITGPARSGRSSTALSLARQARRAGVRILIAAPAKSPLTAWARESKCPVLAPGDDWPAANGSKLASAARVDLIVIDDAEHFSDTAAGDRLLTELMHHPGAAIVSARSDDLLVSFRGIGVEMRRHRTGLLLQPDTVDGELLGIRLTPDRGRPVAGRGLLVTDSTRQFAPNGLAVQVAI